MKVGTEGTYITNKTMYNKLSANITLSCGKHLKPFLKSEKEVCLTSTLLFNMFWKS